MSKSEQVKPVRGLAEVKEIFSDWRRVREKGSHIPRKMWELAVELCKEYSISKVHRALRVDFHSLKRRVDGVKRKSRKTAVSKDSFVKVKVSHNDGRPVNGGPSTPNGHVVEIMRPDGSQLKVHTYEQSCLKDLCSLFLKQP